MDTIFIEEEVDKVLRIAVIDKHRIFNARNPGLLGAVFECSLENPTSQDRAEIFFALAPTINADDIFLDLTTKYKSCKLNTWSVVVKNSNSTNLFTAVSPIDREDRLKLYSTKHSITPSDTITVESKALIALVSFSEKLAWKTGILQRCINSLVHSDYFNDAYVHSIIDEHYRQVMRFKYETEASDVSSMILVVYIRQLTTELGIKHTRDTTSFSEIPISIENVLSNIRQIVPSLGTYNTLRDNLSAVLFLWIGSIVVECSDGYQLELDPIVTKALSHMVSLLIRPDKLAILDTPM